MSGGTTRVMPFRLPMHDHRTPRGRCAGSLLARLLAAGALLAVVSIACEVSLRAQTAQPALFRIFLKDGTALASFGEFTEVGGRVYFSLPLGTGPEQMTSVAATEIDWPRTDQYRDNVRAAHYAATRGEADYAAMSAHVAGLLTEIAKTGDVNEQLRLAVEARRLLIEWPRDHFAYKNDEVRQSLGVLDEVIAGLQTRAGRTGGGAFDLSLVAGVSVAPPLALLDPPSLQDSIAQALRLASLAGSPAERVSMLRSIQVVLDDGDAEEWKTLTRTQVRDAIADEMKTDTAYSSLVTATLASAAKKVANADIRGLTELRGELLKRDEKLGRKRPDQMRSLIATLDQRLDAARRVRLARDQWAVKSDAFRAYQRAVNPSMKLLTNTMAVLNDIRALAGPSMSTLTRVEGRLESQAPALKAIAVPGDLQPAHASLLSAWQMAAAAVQQRKRAISLNNMPLAWNASAAASGALMLLDHARAELTRLMKAPDLP